MSKYITDYGVLMEKFIEAMGKDFAHKSYIKKITNKLERFHKRRRSMCAVSENRVFNAVQATEKIYADVPSSISLGAIVWLIHNKHKEELKPYGFDPQVFEQMNRAIGAQGVVMESGRVLRAIEAEMDRIRDNESS